MATTEHFYEGNNSTTDYSFTFPYLKTDHIKVTLDTVATTAFTLPNSTTVRFNTAPGQNVNIHIYRETDVDPALATFIAGSSIRAVDLNNNFERALYALQEHQGQLVNTADIKDNAITAAKIIANAVGSAQIADNAVTSSELASDSVGSTQIKNNAVGSSKIPSSAVGNTQIADNAVTAAKIAGNAVGSAQIADGAVGSSEIAADAIGAAQIADGAVGSDALAADAVGSAQIADGSVGASEIAADAVRSAQIKDGEVGSSALAADSVGSAQIADGAVGASEIAADAVRSAQIQDGAVGSSEIAADAVGTTQIADNAVTAAQIAANAVGTTQIADAELTTLAGMQSGTASILAGGTTLTSDIADLNQVDGLTKQTTISDSDASFPTSGAVVDYVAAQIAPLGGLEVVATEVVFPNTQPDSGVVISISDAGGVVINGSGVSTTGRTVGGSTVTINGFPSSLYSETLVAGVGLMVSSTGSSQTYNYHKILGKEDDIKQLSDDINDFNARYRVGSSNPSSALDDGDLFFNTGTGKMLVYNASNTAWEEVQSVGNFFINTISSYSGTGGNSASFNGSAYRFVLSNAPSNAEQLLVSVNGVIQKPVAGTSQPSEGFSIDGSSIIFSSAPASGSDYFIITIGASVNIGTPSNNTVGNAQLMSGAVDNAKVSSSAAIAGSKLADDSIAEVKLDVHNAPSGTDKFLAYTSNGMEWAVPTDTNTQVGGATGVDFNDDVKARFGTGNDLEIYHTGTGAYIQNKTGTLYIGSNFDDDDGGDIRIQPKYGENSIVALDDGAVEIYHDNVKKFETTSGGTTVTGDITISDASPSIIFTDTSENPDFKIKVNSGGFEIIQETDDEVCLKAVGNGGVELYYDNSKKFETLSTGVKIDGSDTTGSEVRGDFRFKKAGESTTRIVWDASQEFIKWNDSYKAVFGGSEDLKIYHDPDINVIEINQNNLEIRHGAEKMIACVADGQVELYYDNSTKCRTNSDGLVIEGDCYPDADNDSSRTLGRSDLRWHTVYAGNGTINTSDRNEKNTILESDLGLNFVNRLKPVSYKWNKDDGKTHYGLIAQDVEETLSNDGKTDKDFAALNIPTEGPMGLNYSELISPLIKAVQELSAEVETLKTKVAELEAK